LTRFFRRRKPETNDDWTVRVLPKPIDISTKLYMLESDKCALFEFASKLPKRDLSLHPNADWEHLIPPPEREA
jgi:hypothetical protein